MKCPSAHRRKCRLCKRSCRCLTWACSANLSPHLRTPRIASVPAIWPHWPAVSSGMHQLFLALGSWDTPFFLLGLVLPSFYLANPSSSFRVSGQMSRAAHLPQHSFLILFSTRSLFFLPYSPLPFITLKSICHYIFICVIGYLISSSVWGTVCILFTTMS